MGDRGAFSGLRLAEGEAGGVGGCGGGGLGRERGRTAEGDGLDLAAEVLGAILVGESSPAGGGNGVERERRGGAGRFERGAGKSGALEIEPPVLVVVGGGFIPADHLGGDGAEAGGMIELRFAESFGDEDLDELGDVAAGVGIRAAEGVEVGAEASGMIPEESGVALALPVKKAGENEEDRRGVVAGILRDVLDEGIVFMADGVSQFEHDVGHGEGVGGGGLIRNVEGRVGGKEGAEEEEAAEKGERNPAREAGERHPFHG
jgi:hypothetical protein